MACALLVGCVSAVALAGCGGDRLPVRDYAADREFVVRYREATVEIARRKMAEVEAGVKASPTVVPTGRRLATGGKFGGFFLWDSVFGVMWARYLEEKDFPCLSTLDNFYALQPESGLVSREYTADGRPTTSESHPMTFAPPLLSWAEAELWRCGRSDRSRLARVYPHLKAHHEACRRNFRRADGLYFGDVWGCGMDDIPRWPRGSSDAEIREGGIPFTEDSLCPAWKDKWGWMSLETLKWSWNRQAGWIDMSATMAFDCLNLAKIADALGLAGEAAAFRAEHAELARTINAKCWDDERGFYFDVTDAGRIDRWFVGAYWTLIAKVASPAQARRMIEKLSDPGFFGTPVPVPSLAASDPDFEPETGYWRGAVWPPTTYMTICGLREYGFTKEAEAIARRWYNANAEFFVRTGTVWENLPPDQCVKMKRRSGRDFCGWSALAPIALPAEFGW